MFACVYVFTSVHAWHPGIRPLELEFTDGCVPPCVCVLEIKPKSSVRVEQVLLTVELSLQLQNTLSILCGVCCMCTVCVCGVCVVLVVHVGCVCTCEIYVQKVCMCVLFS